MIAKMLRDRGEEGERRDWVLEGFQIFCFQGKFNSSVSLKLEMCAILRN